MRGALQSPKLIILNRLEVSQGCFDRSFGNVFISDSDLILSRVQMEFSESLAALLNVEQVLRQTSLTQLLMGILQSCRQSHKRRRAPLDFLQRKEERRAGISSKVRWRSAFVAHVSLVRKDYRLASRGRVDLVVIRSK